MAISINPILGVQPAQEAGAVAPELLLQPGTVVDATVLKVLQADLVRIAIAALSIDVRTEIPLQEGQVLKLAVSQTENGIRLTTVGQGGDASADAVTLSPEALVDAPLSPATTSSVPKPALTPPEPKPVLTPLEKVAVTIAAQTAATVQDSQAPLFADLGTAANSAALPPKLLQAVQQVLAQQTSLDPDLSGPDIKTAFQKSGLFLEASLATASVPSGAVPVKGIPDLKAALIVLRQALQSVLASSGATPAAAPLPHANIAVPTGATPLPHAEAAVPAGATPIVVTQTAAQDLDPQEILLPQARVPVADDLGGPQPSARGALFSALDHGSTTAATLNLLQEALQEITGGSRAPGLPADAELPNDAGLLRSAGLLKAAGLPKGVPGEESVVRTNTPPGVLGEEPVIRTNTPPPPFRGALPSAQPVALPSLEPQAPLAATAHHLLGETDAAIARQTLLQVASLPDRVDVPGNKIDIATPRWNFEIPFVTPQGTAMAQFEISRDGGGVEVEAAKRIWRARFSLDVEPAGPVHALVALVGEKTSVRMWAERPATAAQLRAGAAQLSQALSQAELTPGDIVIRDGAPPQASKAPAGHFLDRAL